MKALLPFLFFALVGCDFNANAEEKDIPSPDGYAYTQKEINAEFMIVQIKRFPSFEALTKAVEEDLGIIPDDALGFGGYTLLKHEDGISYCITYIIDPSKFYAPELIGHEMVHCMDGNFHPTVSNGKSAETGEIIK